MMADKTPITAVFCHQWHQLKADHKYGEWDEMWLAADGKGLSGYYDRVHLRNLEGRYVIIPAHQCEQIEISKRRTNQEPTP